jgi:outer membrane protein assembly factor BamA
MRFGLMISSKYQRFVILVMLAPVILAAFSSCSTTRYLSDDDYLLNRVEIKTNSRDIDKDGMKSYLRLRENTRILGFFKFHLWLYNISSKKKDNGWLKRTGESPQLYNPSLAAATKDQLIRYLHNKGYYQARVDMEIRENENRRRINLLYSIHTGDVYRIGNITHSFPDSVLRQLYQSEYTSAILKKGSSFDLDRLDEERDNIVAFYRNKGYYYFSKSMIYFDADTIGTGNVADLNMGIELPFESIRDSMRIFRPYRINSFTWTILGDGPTQEGDPLAKQDSLEYKGNTFLFRNTFRYDPKLFLRLNRMAGSDYYHFGRAEDTFTALNRLRQFRFINIYFQPEEAAGDSARLNCLIDLAPLPRQSLTFDIEGTNTSGNFGIANNINYMHRNLFRGAEILQVKLKGAMERQQAVVSNESLDFNTREAGLEANLAVPRLIGPATLFHSFGNVLPKTLFSLGYNFQRRPDYTRTILSIKLGYEWMTSKNLRHNWNIVDFNMVNLSRFDQEFLNSIYDLYIKSSFTDHLIFGTTYSLIFNTQERSTRSNYSYLRFSAESSGNLMRLISFLAGARKTIESDTTGLRPQEYYKILDSRYAQFVKSDVEFRRGYVLDKYNSVVGRAFLGVGVPYGNFDVLPFEKKYFTGGANGIRAWQVRSLGPGTYQAPPRSYPNQSGDIKIEANVEYRFRLVKYLESALFLDAGNIWAINEKDNRPGAQFRFDRFYRQFALGTGGGIRLDFDYFIFRLDLGVKLRDPAQTQNNGWIPGNRKYRSDDFNFSFAIGYPF